MMSRDEKLDAMTDQALAASDTETMRRLLIAAANDALIMRVIGNEANYVEFAKIMTTDAIVQVASREFEELDDDERSKLRDTTFEHVRKALTQAVMHVWTVCDALQADPLTVPPDTIAFITALRVIPADAQHAAP